MTIEALPYSPSSSIADRLRRRIAYAWHVAPAEIRHPGGVISFTFDDFPKSAAQAGAEVLEQHDARGVYYASRRLSGICNHQGEHFDASDIQRLSGSGHEIASHSYDHIDFARSSAFGISADLDKNAAAMTEMGLSQKMRSFAYPYGEVTIKAKQIVSKHFATGRGVRAGFNFGRCDFSSLLSTPLEARRSNMVEYAKKMIDATIRHGGWLIFYSHDVRPNPSDWGVSPGTLTEIVRSAQKSGAKIMTVAQASSLFINKSAEKSL